ncbi:hypothetical protein CY35_18G064100 [Sphagnum magellanicum]|nr:hypothetical protein CY35_18G064100 [Sphagnum magellanicum]
MELVNNSALDVSCCPQASQNWGSSRFSQQELVETLETHPPHSFYHGEGIPKVPNHPSMEIQSHDIVAAQSIQIVNRVMSGKQDAEDADERQMRMEAPAVDDGYNQGLQVPTWLSNAGTIMVQAGVSCAVPGTALEGHGIESGDVEDVSCHAGTDSKWCPVCAANGSSQCLCGMSMHADDAAISAPAAYSNQNYAHNWSTIQSMMNNMHRPADPQHREDEHLVTSRDCLLRSASHTPPGMVQTETHHSAAHDQQGAVSQQQFVDPRHYPYNLNQDDAFGGQGTNGDQGAVPVEAAWEVARQKEEWEIARYKAMIVAHPLYLQLLELHAGCLRMGTPVDQLRNIDMQMERYMDVTNKYAVLQLDLGPEEQAELNEFMAQYVVVITAFKEHLQQHVYTDITEAMMSCWELEQALSNFTGQVSPLESTGATMSDSESDCDIDGSDDGYEPLRMDQQLETSAAGMYGPLVPSETDRSLMERVRQDLKQELQEGYRAKIEDVREEIMRKRRAGKLPDGTTTVLKAWWNAHSKWPYPTVQTSW